MTTRFLTIVLLLGMFTPVPAQRYKVIYNFGAPGEPSGPRYSGTISQSPGGNLISTADGHWTDFHGRAFEMSYLGTNFTVLQDFGAAAPVGGLILGTDQRFHGTTESGGSYGRGTVFRISPKVFSDVIVQHNFSGGADGSVPESAPIQSEGGHFYGTTSGGTENDGTVYRISASGEYSVLHSFSGPDGAHPFGPLVQAADTGFYGTTMDGGKYNLGTIFRVSAAGHFRVIYSFDGVHGQHPFGPLIQGSDGILYGVTSQGGTMGGGVAFRITPVPDVALTILHNFSGTWDGGNQVGGLVEASDGNFYGTNDIGGDFDWGVLFRITPTGQFTKLHDFEWNTGASPQSTLLHHTNGNLYGHTAVGGTYGDGTMFQYDLSDRSFLTFLNVYGRVGAKVSILGQYFFPESSVVSFNGVPATDVEIHFTFIKAIVPAGATTGPITVTTPRYTLKSDKTFVVHP